MEKPVRTPLIDRRDGRPLFFPKCPCDLLELPLISATTHRPPSRQSAMGPWGGLSRRPRNDFQFFISLARYSGGKPGAPASFVLGNSLRRVANSSAYQRRSGAEATVMPTPLALLLTGSSQSLVPCSLAKPISIQISPPKEPNCHLRAYWQTVGVHSPASTTGAPSGNPVTISTPTFCYFKKGQTKLWRFWNRVLRFVVA
jgi:hypothetical protein